MNRETMDRTRPVLVWGFDYDAVADVRRDLRDLVNNKAIGPTVETDVYLAFVLAVEEDVKAWPRLKAVLDRVNWLQVAITPKSPPPAGNRG